MRSIIAAWVAPLGCCVSLLACRGEEVESASAATDGGADTAAESAVDTAVDPGADTATTEVATSDAGCPTGTMNILQNGTFESWSSGEPDGWGINNSVISVSEQAEDAGNKFVRVTVKEYGNGIMQSVPLPVPLPKGCKLRFSGRTRYVSGPLTPTPDLFMYLFDAEGMSPAGRGSNFPSYSSAMWSSHATEFTADRVVTKIDAYVLGNAPAGGQVFDFDDAVVTYVP